MCRTLLHRQALPGDADEHIFLVRTNQWWSSPRASEADRVTLATHEMKLVFVSRFGDSGSSRATPFTREGEPAPAHIHSEMQLWPTSRTPIHQILPGGDTGDHQLPIEFQPFFSSSKSPIQTDLLTRHHPLRLCRSIRVE